MQLREISRPAAEVEAPIPAVDPEAWSTRRKLIVIVAASTLAWTVWGALGYLVYRLLS